MLLFCVPVDRITFRSRYLCFYIGTYLLHGWHVAFSRLLFATKERLDFLLIAFAWERTLTFASSVKNDIYSFIAFVMSLKIGICMFRWGDGCRPSERRLVVENSRFDQFIMINDMSQMTVLMDRLLLRLVELGKVDRVQQERRESTFTHEIRYHISGKGEE